MELNKTGLATRNSRPLSRIIELGNDDRYMLLIYFDFLLTII